MARKLTKAAKEAQTLLVWLETLELPTRVINALRRDLEVVTGEREGEEGSGVLAGYDQTRFIEELYRPRGGQIGQVPAVAKSAIETLRTAIPALDSADSTSASSDGTTPPQAEKEPAVAVDAATKSDETPQEGAPQAAVSEPNSVGALTDATPEVAQESGEAEPAPVETPVATPRRRGRPRRAEAAPKADEESGEPPVVPTRRRGRAPRSEVAPVTTAAATTADRRAAQSAAVPLAEAPALVQTPPVPSSGADPSFAKLLQLWHELHPQGQRAAMRYMVALLAER